MQLEIDPSTPRLYSSRLESLPSSISNKYGSLPITPAHHKLGNIPNTPLAFKYGTMPYTPGNFSYANSVPTSFGSMPQTPYIASLNRPAPNSPSYLKSDLVARSSVQPRPSVTSSEKNTPEREESLSMPSDTVERRYTASNKEIPFRTISRRGNGIVPASDTLQRPSINSELLSKPIEEIPEEKELDKDVPVLRISIEQEIPLFVAIEDYIPNLPDEIPIRVGDRLQILVQYPDST
ncbi:hypothetical protein HK103_003685 [Boothiomyces macroporosus]|uniref:SH3 domain-containing protein n=1 Tax=Boothiomyces macroporosus TaxID=261099 RepID=A0AAD5UHQ0_9FUNG|nr:hypothetical protein HK103_003685 [Boothiomyces macroporosus]